MEYWSVGVLGQALNCTAQRLGDAEAAQ